MKKVYLMKGMAAMALGLVVASCNKFDAFNPYAEQEAKQQEFTENFQTSVMNGQAIDQNQTWATTTPVQVSVTPSTTGTLKIYTANPIGNVVASLYTADVTAGTKTTFTVAKPADVSKLYAAVINTKGLISDILAFDATESSVDVNLNATASTSNRAARRAAPKRPTQEGAPSNTIVKPTEPTDIPSATNCTVFIDDYTDSEGYGNNSKIYVAPGKTLTIKGQWAGVGTKSKIYLGAGSTLKKETDNLTLENVEIYNDGGTIEGALSLNGAKIWNKGTINAGDVYGSANNPSEIYNEGTITVDNIYFNKSDVLWNEASFTSNGVLSGGNDKTQIYNKEGATIKANSFSLNNNNQLCWNEGTIDITNAASTNNTSAAIVNKGTFKAGSYSQAAGGKFYNEPSATTIISGTTTLGNSNSIWVNESAYTTDYFVVSQGGNQSFNNCTLTVKKKFTMGSNDGSYFVLNNNSSVVCEKDFEWAGDAYFWMGGGSLVMVNENFKANGHNDDGKGFILTDASDYAVVSTNALITDDENDKGRICLDGNIYLDAGTMFDRKFIEGQGNYNIVLTNGASLTTGGQFTAPVHAGWNTEEACSPQYNHKDPDPAPTQWYYYAFEDLGTTDDFDFNDVIIRVSAPVEGTSTVELVAAGGTLATTVLYNEQVFNATEVHKLFGTTPSNSGMVNTGNGPEKKFVTLGTVTLTANDDPADLPFGISAQGTNGQLTKVTHSVENIGKAPLVIVVAGYPSGDNAGRWFWPTERTMISDAYTDFGAWGANASSYQNWYTNYDSNKVYQWNSSKEE